MMLCKMKALSLSDQLSCEELREVSDHISLYFSPRMTLKGSQLIVLPIDPERLYIYWSIDGQLSNQLAYYLLNSELVLMIYTDSIATPIIEQVVSDFKSQSFIQLPSDLVTDISSYFACIGFKSKQAIKDVFQPLVSSTNTPSQYPLSHTKKSMQTHLNLLGSVASHYAASNSSGQG